RARGGVGRDRPLEPRRHLPPPRFPPALLRGAGPPRGDAAPLRVPDAPPQRSRGGPEASEEEELPAARELVPPHRPPRVPPPGARGGGEGAPGDLLRPARPALGPRGLPELLPRRAAPRLLPQPGGADAPLGEGDLLCP